MASSSPRLTVLGGALAGKELTIEDAVDNVLIGSDPSCRFCLQVPGVSPIHARLWIDPQGITVYDTNAAQGLYVNDDRVSTQAALRNGDILWLGTPGQDDVVMIQCRIVSRTGTAPPATRPPEPPQLQATDETAVLQPPAGAYSSSAFESLAQQAGSEAAPVLEPDAPPEATARIEPAPADEPIDQTVVMGVTMEETAFVPPPATEPPPLVLDQEPPFPPPPPAAAEGLSPLEQAETEWRAPAATPPAPPPLPAVSPVFEEDIEEPATARIEAQPTVHMPPPPPAPAPAPVATPAPRTVAAPRHAAAAPRASAPAPRPAMPAPPPAKRAPRPPSGGGSGKLIGIAAALFVTLGGGGAAAWYFLMGPGAQQAPPSAAPPVTMAQAPTPAPLPTEAQPSAVAPTPEPSASVEETVTLVNPPSAAPSALATPSARPSPSPSAGKPSPGPSSKPTAAPTQAAPDPAAVRAQQVGTFLAQADAALGEKRYDAALSLYDQALQLDPQNAQAARGRSSAQAALSSARRGFVSGRSTLVGAKTDKKLSGFESEDVSLAKAPDYSGRLDFEASPRSPQAGESYSVRVFLTNDGKKPFKIASFSASTNASGEKSGGPMAPLTKEIQPQQKALLQEIGGVWREGATSWSLDVSVQSTHGESIRNTLSWR